MSNSITRFRGDTYSIEATLTKESLPLDFTPGNYTATFSYARGNRRITIPGVNGTIEGTISFPFPEDIKAGTYIFDIQVTSSTGEIRTYIKDSLEIVEDISS